MLHAFSYIGDRATGGRVRRGSAEAPAARTVPFDTTIAVAKTSGVALNLEAGGRVHIVGGATKAVRVQVTDRGKQLRGLHRRRLADAERDSVRTGARATSGKPADLQIQVDVPTQTNILLTSAGGQVEIEGIDGFVSGTTESGAVQLFGSRAR